MGAVRASEHDLVYGSVKARVEQRESSVKVPREVKRRRGGGPEGGEQWVGSEYADVLLRKWRCEGRGTEEKNGEKRQSV